MSKGAVNESLAHAQEIFSAGNRAVFAAGVLASWDDEHF
jgi:hypothetical protein